MLDVAYREGLSGNPNDFQKLLEHLRNINVSNKTLLSVQTGLIFSLLSISFIDRKSLRLQRPHDTPTGQQFWFRTQKKAARSLSGETAIQFIAIAVGAGVAGVSTTTSIERFLENSPSWESSFLASILFWIIYGIAFNYPQDSITTHSTPEDFLRLADIESALASISNSKSNREPLTMWRTRRGRDEDQAAYRINRTVDQFTDPRPHHNTKQLSTSGHATSLRNEEPLLHRLKTLPHKIKAFTITPLTLALAGGPVIQVLLLVLLHAKVEIVLGSLIICAAVAAVSLLAIYLSIKERLSQRNFSSLYLLAWIAYAFHPAFFATLVLKLIAEQHPLNFVTIIGVNYLLILALNAFIAWGCLLATPFQSLDEKVVDELLKRTRKELESEKRKILIKVHTSRQEEQLLTKDN